MILLAWAMGLHHDHDHHEQSHHHHQLNPANYKRVLWVLLLTASFMGVEFVCGWLANSLALIADSFHMLTDVAALGLTLFAFYVSQRPATDKNTFGFYRMEILAAFINGVMLAVIALAIIYHAIERLRQPPSIEAGQVLLVAFIGLLINLISGYILIHGDRDNLNMKGALFHVMGDALASVGTLVAAALILWKGWYWADPVVSAVIAVIIIFSAYRLISDTVHVILQGAPLHVDLGDVRQSLLKVEGVSEIHNLHVWSLSSNMVILTVHIVESAPHTSGLLETTKKMLREKFNIQHTTIQIEQTSLEAHEPRF